MGLAPLAYVLYTRVMRHNPSNADWPGRDRFVLSAGHASMLLYSMLYLTGYPLTLDDIKNFRQVGSPTAGHPERKYSPGIEATTGPLGQGISNAVGLALGERMLAARFGEEVAGHHTFTIASDGDMQEGVASEASSLAGHLGLGRLIAFYDDNKIQLASEVDVVMSEDVAKRYEAYGWHVHNLGETNDPDEIERATRAAMEVEDRPSLILIRTHIGYGSPNKQDTTSAHGSPLGEDEVRAAKENLGWDPDKHFYVPDEALAHFRECCGRGRELEEEWSERFAAYREANPDEAALFDAMQRGEMPEGFDQDVPRFDADPKGMATRKASGAAIQWAAKRVPQLVGGSADLASSTNTDIDDGGDVTRGDYSGRNIHFGVREHGMGAIVNGLCLQGLRGYGATFLTFSDYMRGAVRLSALMKLPSIWVWTHDSIGLGEDGPTHQPVEHLAGAAGDPATQRAAPGRRQRDRPRVAVRPPPDRGADRVRAVAAEPAGARPGLGPGRRDRARRVRAERLGRRRSGGDPDRHRVGGVAVRRGRRAAGGRGRGRSRRVDALHGHLHGGRRVVPRRGAAAVGSRPRGGRGGQPARVGQVDRAGRRLPGHDHVRRVGPGQGRVRALRDNFGEAGRARPVRDGPRRRAKRLRDLREEMR